MGAHHDTHDHGSHDHGSHASYIKGFILSVILTAIPFAVVMAGGFENRLLTVALIVGFAVVQILVHMVYFLHMTAKHEEGWTMMSTLFTLIVLGSGLYLWLGKRRSGTDALVREVESSGTLAPAE